MAKVEVIRSSSDGGAGAGTTSCASSESLRRQAGPHRRWRAIMASRLVNYSSGAVSCLRKRLRMARRLMDLCR